MHLLRHGADPLTEGLGQHQRNKAFQHQAVLLGDSRRGTFNFGDDEFVANL